MEDYSSLTKVVTDFTPSSTLAPSSSPSIEPNTKALDGRSKPRTEKQLEATRKMKVMRETRREELKTSGQQSESFKRSAEEEKSVEMATAMFMDMRKKEKENKKELAWESQLNKIMTSRMDEFEERLVNMFSEPIDHFMSRKKQKKSQEAPLVSSPKDLPDPHPKKTFLPVPLVQPVKYKSKNPFSR